MALLASGVPAVIGMQVRVPDEAAILFSRKVYERLAQGDPIEAAVAEGRLLLATEPIGASWAIPVVFLRGEDGRIDVFAPSPPAPEPVKTKMPRRWPRRVVTVIGTALLATATVMVRWGYNDLGASQGPTPPSPVPSPIIPPPAPKATSATVQLKGSDYHPAGALPATLSARFFERDGGRFVRFQLVPEGSGSVQTLPMLETNRGSHDLVSGAERWQLDVLDIRWAESAATVRLRRLG